MIVSSQTVNSGTLVPIKINKEKEKWHCQCSKSCDAYVKLTSQEADRILKEGLVLIVEGCPNGPSPKDQLVATLESYKLYRQLKEKS